MLSGNARWMTSLLSSFRLLSRCRLMRASSLASYDAYWWPQRRWVKCRNVLHPHWVLLDVISANEYDGVRSRFSCFPLRGNQSNDVPEPDQVRNPQKCEDRVREGLRGQNFRTIDTKFTRVKVWPYSKFEYRNPKQTQKQINLKRENPKHRMRRTFVWNFAYFGHLKLFRISDFVLRIIPLMGTALIPSRLNQRDRLPPRYVGAWSRRGSTRSAILSG